MQTAPVLRFLEAFAPLELAEDWDNVGLLLGDADSDLAAIMTCLTLTPDVAAEAIKLGVGLIVTHHPILFRPVQRLTNATAEGRMLLALAAHRICVYSPHTAFDSGPRGINQQWAERLQLTDIAPIRPVVLDQAPQLRVGGGRFGRLPKPVTLAEFLEQLKSLTGRQSLEFVGAPDQTIHTVGIACGAATEFLSDAQAAQCDLLITGEARFHACLEARTKSMSLVLVGHYNSERFACEQLAEILAEEFPSLDVFASGSESDPLNLA